MPTCWLNMVAVHQKKAKNTVITCLCGSTKMKKQLSLHTDTHFYIYIRLNIYIYVYTIFFNMHIWRKNISSRPIWYTMSAFLSISIIIILKCGTWLLANLHDVANQTKEQIILFVYLEIACVLYTAQTIIPKMWSSWLGLSHCNPSLLVEYLFWVDTYTQSTTSWLNPNVCSLNIWLNHVE